MAVTNINRVIISGNLTADPDLRETSTGHTVCEMRLANNVPIKKEGKWDSKVNFVQINAWAGLGENCAKHLSKGSPIMVDGRLDWQFWENKDGGSNSRIVIIAEQVQFGNKREQKTNGKPDSKPEAEKPKTSGAKKSDLNDDKEIAF